MRLIKKSWQIATTSSILMLAIICSACGSNAGGNNTSSTSPLTVGELFSMSGRGASYGQWIDAGARVGVQEVNSHGGVMGHPLVESLQDTQSDPVDAVPAWHQLVIQNPAFMLGPTSKEIQGVIKLYDPAHLVTFMEGGTTSVDTMNYKYVYRVTPSDTTLTATMAYYAVQKGYKNAALFFEATADASLESDSVAKFFTAHGGTVVDSEHLALHQASYRTEVAKAFAANPDVVFVQGDPETASTLFSNIIELGHMNVPFIGDDNGVSADFAKAMGFSNANKWLVGIAGAPPQGPAWQHYVAEYQSVLGTAQPFEQSSDTYDAVIIASLAMTAAKSTDSRVWVDKITTVANPPGTKCYTYSDCVALLNQGQKINYEGATGPEDFNKYHNVFGDWNIAQFTPDGSSLNVVSSVPASAIDQYVNG